MFLALATLLTVGQTMPPFSGEFLTGRKASLPDAARGKHALVAIGFSYDSRFPVEAWVKRFRQDFDKRPDVTFFEVPMISGMARMGRWFIDNGMRRGTPKENHENVITVYGGAGAWKTLLKAKDDRTAYLLLLDPAGKILWLHGGGVDEVEFARLAALLPKSPDR